MHPPNPHCLISPPPPNRQTFAFTTSNTKPFPFTFTTDACCSSPTPVVASTRCHFQHAPTRNKNHQASEVSINCFSAKGHPKYHEKRRIRIEVEKREPRAFLSDFGCRSSRGPKVPTAIRPPNLLASATSTAALPLAEAHLRSLLAAAPKPHALTPSSAHTKTHPPPQQLH